MSFMYMLRCSGREIDSRTPGYPLRTKENIESWATLTPLPHAMKHDGTNSRHTGGLTLQPHFGGKVRKQRIADNPYTPLNPCLEKKSGQGPAFLGYFQRDELLSRKHKANYRGPRASSRAYEESGS